MNKRNKIFFAIAGAVFFALAVGLGISIGLYLQQKRAVELREYEKELQDEGGDKNGISLEYQEDEQRKLLKLQKEVFGTVNQDYADTLSRVSEFVFEERNFPEAESLTRESIATYQKLLAANPDAEGDRMGGIERLSRILWHENKMAEAEALARKTVEYQKTGFGPGNLDHGPPPQIDGLGLLASILWDEGKWTEAQAVYDQGFKVRAEFDHLNEEKPVVDPSVPSCAPGEGSAQYLFRQTNVVQKIPGWGDLIDPEGGCVFRSEGGTLALLIPGTVHPMGHLITNDIEGTVINRVYYSGREIHILQQVTGDFTIQVKVQAKYENDSKTEYKDVDIFTDVGLLLLDGTNNINFFSSLNWSSEREFLENPVLSLNYNLSSYKTKYRPYMDYSLGFAGKFSYLRMVRTGELIHLAISRDNTHWLELLTLPAPPSEKVMVGLEASHSSHNPATVEFSEFKLTHSAVP